MAPTAELREALVLLILDALARRDLTPIREYELHQLVRRLQIDVGNPFRFLDKPVSYSYDLQTCLKALEQSRFLDELILVRDGWVPRYEYELSVVGLAEAADDRQRLQLTDPALVGTIEQEIDDFASTYRAPVPINPYH